MLHSADVWPQRWLQLFTFEYFNSQLLQRNSLSGGCNNVVQTITHTQSDCSYSWGGISLLHHFWADEDKSREKKKKTVSILFPSKDRGEKILAQNFSPYVSSSLRDFASQAQTSTHPVHSNKQLFDTHRGRKKTAHTVINTPSAWSS